MDTAIQLVIDAVGLGGLYALLALGIALIFGIMDLINFAYGELIMIGGYTLVLLSDLPLALALPATVATVVLASLAMDRIAFRPIRLADPTTLLITSFALSYLLQNLAILAFGSLPKTTGVGSGLAGPIALGGITVSKLDIVVILVAISLIVGLVTLVQRTSMGIRMRAAAENFEMARTLGVRADRVIALAFALSGVLAAVAAFFLIAQTGSVSPLFGVSPVLIAFIATILGGLGSLSGAVIAGFGLGALTVVLQQLLPDGLQPYRDAFVFTVVLITLIVRPDGLIPQRARTARV